MNPVLKIALTCITLMALSPVMAQKPANAAGRSTTVQKAKPKFRSAIGSYADSVVITVAEAEKAVVSPISVKDEKNLSYPIISYQLAYKRLAAVEDEETKKVSPVTSLVAKQFNVTPVPESWSKYVLEQLKAGEELIFFDIVVKDAAGKLYFVPDIRIKTK